MENRTAPIARACARDLAPRYGPSLPVAVEDALTGRRPGHFVDGVDVASLVVSAASMAWTIYNDIAERAKQPNRDELSEAYGRSCQRRSGTACPTRTSRRSPTPPPSRRSRPPRT